jgi:fatty acid amide hydrolase
LLASDEITGMGAAEIARRIAVGDLSCRQVVEAHIRRIEAVNPPLGALAVPLFDRARDEALAADVARDRGVPLGPLHGVPLTVKEFFAAAGTATTLGIPGWARRVASADSPLVARLRRAGAILLSKSNVPQLGLMIETDNPLYGRTNNPWNPSRSVGGSTGGEAALIAAGGSPLGLGSDGGGSIRQPCHCCGIHGLKPTGGRLTIVGLTGPAHYPDFPREWVQPGPMARRVEDLALAMAVLVAPGPEPMRPGRGGERSERRAGPPSDRDAAGQWPAASRGATMRDGLGGGSGSVARRPQRRPRTKTAGGRHDAARSYPWGWVRKRPSVTM